MAADSKKSRFKADDIIEPDAADFTSSITETDTDDFGDSSVGGSSRMLGAEPLKSDPHAKLLLRLQEGILKPALAAELQQAAYSPSRRVTEEVRSPLILGPFLTEQLKKIAAQGLLSHQDCLINGFGRWKPVREFFPEFVDASPTDEVTDTLTAPTTTSGGIYPDDEGTDTETVGGLELESVEDIKSTNLAKSLAAPADKSSKPEEPRSRNVMASLDLESDEVPKKPEAPKAPPTVSARPAMPASTAAASAPVPAEAKTSWPTLLGAAVVAGLGVYLLMNRHNAAPPPPANATVHGDNKAAPVASDLPPNLRPQRAESLYADDSALVAKIRPILNAYENGSLVLSAADEKTLREAADPASASFEARRLAANQLAVYFLASSRLDDARAVLKPILEAATSDPTTLLNAALLHLSNNEISDARESATAALRLMPPANSWIAYCVTGVIEGYRSRFDQAENYFKDALRRSPNNPFVYGLYIRTLMDSPHASEVVPGLIREALWADPDRLLDSPIRAPLAGHILASFAFDGLLKGAEMRESRLSPGKKAFVRWLEARYRHNPLSQPLARVSELLSQETDPQSQVLYAFVLREQGRMDESADTLNRVIPVLQGQDEIKSSWPWSFAGDVQSARGNVSQGIVFYQNALSRNPQDIAAVLGMALAFRERGEYTLAEQKLSEALSLDPFFIPALLRVSRFEWHSGTRAQ